MTEGAMASAPEASGQEDGAIDTLVNRGLRNFWYPVAPSWMVHAAPVGLTRLGERMVV
jgi:hypothetical protein